MVIIVGNSTALVRDILGIARGRGGVGGGGGGGGGEVEWRVLLISAKLYISITERCELNFDVEIESISQL